MEEKIQKIRELLDEIEGQGKEEAIDSFRESFGLFELPELVASIVDYLQPLLSPYEAGIYWFMFRHSIIATGDVYARVSRRGLGEDVLTSASGQSVHLSYGAVKKALAALEEKRVISEAGDTNRQGTLYRVHLPEEIDICQERMKSASRIQLPEVDPGKELDFYNVKQNRTRVFERDGYQCQHCSKQLTRFSATLDHVVPVSEGGDNSYNNLITACLQCNSRRGARPISDLLP